MYACCWKAIALLFLWTKATCCGQDADQEKNRIEIVETIDIAYFGEPQAVLNEHSTITRHKIREIQQYMASQDSWKKTCLNRHQMCSVWAAQEECTKNAPWMRQHCAASCRRCLLPSGHERDQSDPTIKEGLSVPQQQQSHIMVAIPYGESQVLPTTNADSVVQTIAKMTKYMQQKVHADEIYATMWTDCTCKDSNCALWASQGEESIGAR
jgi:hypothetical protein